ncbi:MAG: hypothetical protein Q8O95_02155 [bacterium]|nr:hypothetical protein [bacterium]
MTLTKEDITIISDLFEIGFEKGLKTHVIPHFDEIAAWQNKTDKRLEKTDKWMAETNQWMEETNQWKIETDGILHVIYLFMKEAFMKLNERLDKIVLDTEKKTRDNEELIGQYLGDFVVKRNFDKLKSRVQKLELSHS